MISKLSWHLTVIALGLLLSPFYQTVSQGCSSTHHLKCWNLLLQTSSLKSSKQNVKNRLLQPCSHKLVMIFFTKMELLPSYVLVSCKLRGIQVRWMIHMLQSIMSHQMIASCVWSLDQPRDISLTIIIWMLSCSQLIKVLMKSCKPT